MKTYLPHGVCAREIKFKVENDIVSDISFKGGCDGNLKGLAQLSNGRNINEIITLLSGITCRSKSTSCPDQLAIALKKLNQNYSNI